MNLVRVGVARNWGQTCDIAILNVSQLLARRLWEYHERPVLLDKFWRAKNRKNRKPNPDVLNPHGQVGLEFKLRPFSAGSILTLRNRIEPLASKTSLDRTSWKIQSTKLTPSMTAPGKLAIHITRGLFVLLTFSRLMLRTTGL
jgi:hypothetical protein